MSAAICGWTKDHSTSESSADSVTAPRPATTETGLLVMKRIEIGFVTLFLSMLAGAVAADVTIPEPPAIAATSYVLVDAASEKVLVEHLSHHPQPPA